MSADASLETDPVFVRTPAGQRELVIPSGSLSPIESRLLAAVTGFTPISVFAELGMPTPDDAIRTLHARRLIEPNPA